jgi:hypothetical protein
MALRENGGENVCCAVLGRRIARPRLACLRDRRMDVKEWGDQAPPSKLAKPQSSQRVAKRFASGRAIEVANEQRIVALCYHRASKWADALREGLDRDIACFIRDQVVAWQFLATSYASCARHTPYTD